MESHRWTRIRTLGRGSSAIVSLAFDRHSGELFAVKSVELNRMELLQREHRILSLTGSCPRVVACTGHGISVENGRSFYNLFLEYIPGGTLSDAIRSHGGRLEEPAIRRATRELLLGLSHLHAKGIAHCDIKGQNILMSPDGAKVADLGCARLVGEDGRRQVAGTPLYMAPEVARGEEQGLEADIWAVGCTVIEMATGRPPWTDGVDDPVAALHRIGRSSEVPRPPRELSDEGRDFLSKCWERRSEARWSADQLLKHPFLLEESQLSSERKSLVVSPTSILDQGCLWGSAEETHIRPFRNEVGLSSEKDQYGSPAERLQTLICSESRSEFTSGDTDCEGSWVSVRILDRSDSEIASPAASVYDIRSSKQSQGMSKDSNNRWDTIPFTLDW